MRKRGGRSRLARDPLTQSDLTSLEQKMCATFPAVRNVELGKLIRVMLEFCLHAKFQKITEEDIEKMAKDIGYTMPHINDLMNNKVGPVVRRGFNMNFIKGIKTGRMSTYILYKIQE